MSRANPRYHRNNPLGNPVGGTVGLVRYIIRGTIEGQMTINSFDFQATNPFPSQAQLSTLLTAISAGLLTKWRALISSDWSVVQEQLNVIHRNDIMGLVSTLNAGFVGTRAAGHEPTEVAQPIIKITGLKGQHGRGRVSVPAIATADVTASTITAAAWQTAAQSFIAAVQGPFSDGANTWAPGVTTRVKPSPVAQYYTYMNNMRVSPLLGTIRRRKIGRGK